MKGHRPLLAVIVEIDEIFHHCSTAFPRSALWDAASWDPEGRVPRRAVIAQLCERPEGSIEALDALLRPGELGARFYA